MRSNSAFFYPDESRNSERGTQGARRSATRRLRSDLIRFTSSDELCLEDSKTYIKNRSSLITLSSTGRLSLERRVANVRANVKDRRELTVSQFSWKYVLEGSRNRRVS